jgi:hypothetical protein
MTSRRRSPSPAQIRARGALAFRNRQRLQARAPAPAVQRTVLESPAKLAQPARFVPPAVRLAMTDETPLSPAEVAHGLFHGLIKGRSLA